MKKVLVCLVLICGFDSAFSQKNNLILLLVPIPGSYGYYGQLVDSSGLYIGPVTQIAHQVGQAFLRSPTGTIITAEVGAATTTFSMYAEEASKAISDIILMAAESEVAENDEVTTAEDSGEGLSEETVKDNDEISDLELGDSELTDNTVKKIENFISSLLQENSTETKSLSYDEILALFKAEAKNDEDLREYKEEEIVAAYYLALDLYLQESGQSIHSIKSTDDLRNILFGSSRWKLPYIIAGAKKKYPNTKLVLKMREWAKSDPLNGIYGLTEEDIANAYHNTILNFNRLGFGSFVGKKHELQLKMLLIEKRSFIVERLNKIIKENQHRERGRGRVWH